MDDDDLDFGPSSLTSRRPPRTGERAGRAPARGDSQFAAPQRGMLGVSTNQQAGPAAVATAVDASSSPLCLSNFSLEPVSAPLQLCVLLLQALAPGHPLAVCKVSWLPQGTGWLCLQGTRARCVWGKSEYPLAIYLIIINLDQF